MKMSAVLTDVEGRTCEIVLEQIGPGRGMEIETTWRMLKPRKDTTRNFNRLHTEPLLTPLVKAIIHIINLDIGKHWKASPYLKQLDWTELAEKPREQEQKTELDKVLAQLEKLKTESEHNREVITRQLNMGRNPKELLESFLRFKED